MYKKKTYASIMFYDRLGKFISILKWLWTEKTMCKSWEYLTEQVTENVLFWFIIQKTTQVTISSFFSPSLLMRIRNCLHSLCLWLKCTSIPVLGVHSELHCGGWISQELMIKIISIKVLCLLRCSSCWMYDVQSFLKIAFKIKEKQQLKGGI